MNKTEDCNTETITEVLMRHVSDVKLDNEVSSTLTYGLPQNQTCHFEQLFLELDDRKTELFITNFGVSATTLEEVFLR